MRIRCKDFFLREQKKGDKLRNFVNINFFNAQLVTSEFANKRPVRAIIII